VPVGEDFLNDRLSAFHFDAFQPSLERCRPVLAHEALAIARQLLQKL